MCSLYIVEDTLSGDVKIGISNNPKERKKHVKTLFVLRINRGTHGACGRGDMLGI